MSSESSSGSSRSDFCPVPLSAQGLHKLAVQAFRVGNRGRLSLWRPNRGSRERDQPGSGRDRGHGETSLPPLYG